MRCLGLAVLAGAAACAGAAGTSSSQSTVVRELKIYPPVGGADGTLAPGWFSYSWNGKYDVNSAAVTPFRGAACVQGLANPYGALSFYTVSPFEGPTSLEGWDAVDFWMRGRDALALSVFVLPFSGAVSAAVGPQAMRLTPIETIGRSVADLAVDTNPFATRLVRPVNATAPPSVAAMGLPASLDRWTLFRIDLGELAGIKWERINWKNDKVSPCAEFYVDEVRLIRFAQQPPAQAEEPSQQPQLLSPPPPPPRAPPRSPRSPPPPPDAPDAPVAAAQPQQAATPPARPPPQLVPRPVTPTPSPSPSPSQSSRATPPSTSPPSLDSRLAALAAVQEESPAPPQQKTPQASSSLMDNLRNMVGSSASHAGDTEEELNQHIASRGGFRGILAAAGLQLSEMMNGGVSGPGLSPMGPAMGGAPPGYGPGYSTPENSAPGSLWGVPGGANPAAAQPGGGTTNVAPGVGIQGGGYGGGEPFAGGGGGGGYGGGANVISGGSGGYGGPGGMVAPGVFASGSSAINSGASTNAVDPVYGAGIYGGGGVAGTTGGIPLTTRPSVFYGGSYGGSGVFVAGRSLVRIYLFSSCVHPALAAEWPGCWCFLCYADVSPSTLSIGGQKLLNAYALVANAVAANDIKAAAIQAQRIAGAQAIQQNINQRIVATAAIVLDDARTTSALIYAIRQNSKQAIASTLYGIHNPAWQAVNAAVNSQGTTVVVTG